MAEVILAEMCLGRGATRLAVLKRIWPELARDPDFLPMFIHEGRLSALMNHPNVVQTYEVLEDAERPTIALEYLDGQPLNRVLARLSGPDALGLAPRLRILMNLLAALEYAHELTDYDGSLHEVVHRDVSPQNVFVTYSGQIKLLDFGVAKSLLGLYQTRPGSIKGRLAYMAPEQLRGGVVDRRVDVFAVGVMLWEMAAGRRLWQGMTEGAVIRHLNARAPVPPLFPTNPKLPPGLDRICARALAPDPEARYATAAAFESEIAALLSDSEEGQARRLGKVVSLAFAEERAARQTLIERRLGGIPAPVAWSPYEDTFGEEPTPLSIAEAPPATSSRGSASHGKSASARTAFVDAGADAQSPAADSVPYSPDNSCASTSTTSLPEFESPTTTSSAGSHERSLNFRAPVHPIGWVAIGFSVAAVVVAFSAFLISVCTRGQTSMMAADPSALAKVTARGAPQSMVVTPIASVPIASAPSPSSTADSGNQPQGQHGETGTAHGRDSERSDVGKRVRRRTHGYADQAPEPPLWPVRIPEQSNYGPVREGGGPSSSHQWRQQASPRPIEPRNPYESGAL